MKDMYDKTFTNNYFLYYHELHPCETDIAVIDAGTSFFIHLLQHLFTKIGWRKMAKIKEKNNQDYELVVQCPYCYGVTYQKKITRKYQCMYCKKKAYIMLGPAGLFMLMATKRMNNPQTDNVTEDGYNKLNSNT